MTKRTEDLLATMTDRDDAGRHFTSRYDSVDLAELESAGLIRIDRPVHAQSGLPYSQEHWSVEVTPDGLELVNEFYA